MIGYVLYLYTFLVDHVFPKTDTHIVLVYTLYRPNKKMDFINDPHIPGLPSQATIVLATVPDSKTVIITVEQYSYCILKSSNATLP